MTESRPRVRTLVAWMKITVLFVVEDRRPVGIVHMHDLLRIGVA